VGKGISGGDGTLRGVGQGCKPRKPGHRELMAGCRDEIGCLAWASLPLSAQAKHQIPPGEVMRGGLHGRIRDRRPADPAWLTTSAGTPGECRAYTYSQKRKGRDPTSARPADLQRLVPAFLTIWFSCAFRSFDFRCGFNNRASILRSPTICQSLSPWGKGN
jgi:hypothetical protein